MNRPTQKKKDGNWSRSSKLMLLTTFILLLCFSVWSSFAMWSRQKLVGELQEQYEQGISQSRELETLFERHNLETTADFEGVKSKLIEMHNRLDTKEGFFPILKDEFVVLLRNGAKDSGEKFAMLTVPEQGEHRLRIELWRKQKRLANQTHELERGKEYVLRFKATENAIEVEFPGEGPNQYALENFAAYNVFADGIRQRDRTPFIAINRPTWTRGLVYHKPIKVGVLTEFRFEQVGFSIDGAVTVRIVSESKGPITAAADDLQTVSKLLEMLIGIRKLESFQFENGLYVFE